MVPRAEELKELPLIPKMWELWKLILNVRILLLQEPEHEIDEIVMKRLNNYKE